MRQAIIWTLFKGAYTCHLVPMNYLDPCEQRQFLFEKKKQLSYKYVHFKRALINILELLKMKKAPY